MDKIYDLPNEKEGNEMIIKGLLAFGTLLILSSIILYLLKITSPSISVLIYFGAVTVFIIAYQVDKRKKKCLS